MAIKLPILLAFAGLAKMTHASSKLAGVRGAMIPAAAVFKFSAVQAGACVDLPGWKDVSDYDCHNGYIDYGMCANGVPSGHYGGLYARDKLAWAPNQGVYVGIGADKACCGCGYEGFVSADLKAQNEAAAAMAKAHEAAEEAKRAAAAKAEADAKAEELKAAADAAVAADAQAVQDAKAAADAEAAAEAEEQAQAKATADALALARAAGANAAAAAKAAAGAADVASKASAAASAAVETEVAGAKAAADATAANNSNAPNQGGEVYTGGVKAAADNGSGGSPDCIDAFFGSSPNDNKKEITIKHNYYKCPKIVNKKNWHSHQYDGIDTYGRYDDEFAVEQVGEKVIATRTDVDKGWTIDLSFACCWEKGPAWNTVWDKQSPPSSMSSAADDAAVPR